MPKRCNKRRRELTTRAIRQFYTTSSSYFDHALQKRKPQDKPAENVSDKGLDGAKKKRDKETGVENTPFRVILLVVERAKVPKEQKKGECS